MSREEPPGGAAGRAVGGLGTTWGATVEPGSGPLSCVESDEAGADSAETEAPVAVGGSVGATSSSLAAAGSAAVPRSTESSVGGRSGGGGWYVS